MSTNFYLIKPISEEARAKAHALLDEALDNNSTGWYEIEELLKAERCEIHLGHRACGWQFLWRAHHECPNMTLLQIQAFIRAKLNEGYHIEDEYRQTFTFDEFFDEEVGESLYAHFDAENNRVYHNHETYLKDHPEDRYMYHGCVEFYSSDGLRYTTRDFS